MLDYCLCPKCERMIMLDGDFQTGFCLYCGTHIAFDEAKEMFLSGLRSAIPDELALEVDLSDLIDEDDAEVDSYGLSECREECSKAQEYMGKWDFAKAYEHFVRALDWYPSDFESSCGRLTAGILKLNDVENWESRLIDTTSLIRSQTDWNMAQKSLEYALGILKRFLSKGGRFVAPYYTYGFFKRMMESFPTLREVCCDIYAHCLNVDNAPFTDAARLDHETTRFAVGSFSAEPDKNLRHPLLLILKYHHDPRVKEQLCRALYVYDRGAWLRNKDDARINDVIEFMETAFREDLRESDKKLALSVGYDLLMMGGIEPASTQREKLLFLSTVYSYQQLKRMERFFGGSVFFNKVYAEVYLKQKGASLISAEYKRLQEKIRRLSENDSQPADFYAGAKI